MTKQCIVTGKKPQSGNNVSKSNRKTRRTFEPNLQVVSLYSEILAAPVNMRVSTNGLRTIEKNGGLDNYLLSKTPSRLTEEMKELKKRIEKAKAKKAA